MVAPNGAGIRVAKEVRSRNVLVVSQVTLHKLPNPDQASHLTASKLMLDGVECGVVVIIRQNNK